MTADDRKLQQRIARRKERVERLIAEQEARLASIRLATYLRRGDYTRDQGRRFGSTAVEVELRGYLRARGLKVPTQISFNG